MKKYFRKITLGLCVAFLVNLFSVHTLALNSASAENDQTMTMIFNYWDAYTNQETGEYTPPSYFGGFIIEDDRTLTVCVTEDTAEVHETINLICGSNRLGYKTVDYSFNDLYALQMEILEEKNCTVETTTISIPNNSVNVYFNSDIIDESAPMSLPMSLNHPAVAALTYESDEAVAESTHDISLDTACTDLIDFYESDSVSPRAISEFYPSQLTHPMGGTGNGTIGFVATDSAGRKILITHGHTYIDQITTSNQYTDCLTVTFDGDSTTYPVYILSTSGNLNEKGSVTSYLDAAYIPVSGVLSTTMDNSANLNGAVYSSQLSSVSNISGKYCGSVHNDESGTVTVADSSYIYMNCSSPQSNRTGDSGAPIYLTDSSSNRLVGIVKSSVGANGVNGILWTTIANAYYTCIGRTLTLKLV